MVNDFTNDKKNNALMKKMVRQMLVERFANETISESLFKKIMSQA